MMKKKMKMLIMGGTLALMAMPVKAQKWDLYKSDFWTFGLLDF